MDGCFIRFYIVILFFISIIEAIANKETSLDDSRKPRVSSRIVKLYSGPRPVPILCTGEGFQADAHDCAVFYRCMKSGNGKYTIFRFQCGPGTVYDPETEVCNHPQSTKRSECGGLLPAFVEHDNFNEIEGIKNEVPSPISTKQPMYFEHTTTHESTSDMSAQHTVPDISTMTFTPYSGMSTSISSTVSSSSASYPFITSTVNLNPKYSETSEAIVPLTAMSSTWKPGVQDKENICTTDGFMGDTRSCRKFYRCVANHKGGYTRYEFSCSEPTIWDDDVQGCNHAWAVKKARCGTLNHSKIEQTDHIDQSAVSDENIQQQLQISYGSKVTQIQTQISNGSVSQYQTQINYGDRINTANVSTSKQNQTQVSHGSATSQSQTQIDYGNKGVQTQLQIDHSEHSSQIQTQEYASSTQATSSSIPAKELNTDKNDVCVQSGFMGDSKDCKKFYRCIDNGRGGFTRFEFSCGEGTVWDSNLEACNHAWAVKECGGKAPSGTITHTIYSSTFKTTQTYHTAIPAEGYDTTSHTETIDKNEDIGYGNQNEHPPTTASTTVTKISMTEPWINENTEYGNHNQQHTTISTTEAKTSTTGAFSGIGTECTTSGFIGDENDCKIFYRCVENGKGFTKYEFKCGDGTVWDPNIEACNHAWAVKKCGVSISTDINKLEGTTIVPTAPTTLTQSDLTTTTTKPISTDNDNYDTGYGSENNDFSSSTSTTQQPQKIDSSLGNTCKTSGFMGDENNCKIFYRCVENGKGFTKYEFKCGEGTVWDSNIEACNHAWAVKKCGGNASTDINKLDVTTTVSTVPTGFTQSALTTTTTKPISTDNDSYDTGYGSQNNDLSSSTSTSKQPQNLDSNLGNTCVSSGFMGDKDDCKRFYRCVDNGDGSFTRYEFACGEGTVWDSEIDACNHVWAVKKCGGGGHGLEIEHKETTARPQVSSTHESETSSSSTEKFENTTMTTEYSKTSITTTTLQSVTTSSNKCIHNGFMGDNIDCKKFYRCVDDGNGSYTRYEFSCGEGTVWDPKIDACNHAWAVDKCGINIESTDDYKTSTPSYHPTISDDHNDNYSPDAQSQGTEQHTTSQTLTVQSTTEESNKDNNCKYSGFIGDNKDCKKFYRCVDDSKGSYIRYEFSCGEGTLWDQSIEACNHAWAVKDCGEDGKHSTSTQITTTNIGHTTSESEDQGYVQHTEATSTSSIAGSYQENQTNDIMCTKEGFVGDKNNCQKFYRCVNDGRGSMIKHEFKCGEGTYWNQEILSCDHVAPDKPCGDKDSTLTTKAPQHIHDEMNDTDTTAALSSPMTTDRSSEGVITEKPQSQEVCNSEGFHGDPNNCKMFYRCVDNGKGSYTKYEFACGDGTVWDQEIQACNHESDSKCVSSSTTSISQTSTTQSITSGSSTSTSTETQHSTEKTETSSPSTSDTCTSEGFFAHAHNCKKFVRCVDNSKGGYTKYEFTCGEGTVWVQDILACDHDNGNPNCMNLTQSTTKPLTTVGQQQTSEESNSSVSSTSKPQTTDKLEDEYSSGSSGKPSGSGTCTLEGYYGDASDCRRFYRCIDNGQGGYTKYDYTCGEGTAWDNEIQNCNHFDQVKTCHGTTQESGVTQPVMHEEGNGLPTDATSTSSTFSTTTTSSASSQDMGSNDSCIEEGFFGNTKDCTKFYRCIDDGKGGYIKYDFTCGEGTIWDTDVTTCNHPQDVANPSCSNNQHGSTTTITTSSSSSSTSSGDSTTQSTSSSSSTIQSTLSSDSTTQSTIESTTKSSSNCSQEQSSKKPVNEGVNCTTEGYYPSPNDCKKYYRCVDWDGDGSRFSVYHFECGEGTIWDPALETCNHEESVYPPRNCSGSQEQNVAQHTTTTEGTTTDKEETISQISTTYQPTSYETTQSSTSEYTTTQQSTTLEQTTTQESTTTQQTETSEQTTTPQSTSTEHPTTQQSTTPEQTTTQESTTSDQTTTQKSTTSEQTTTVQSTASEQTTTQQSTTLEQTTTQQTTISEQTTTPQTTTSEHTTSQQSTISEQTTTQQSTSSQQTTQESTTSEQTTSQSTTTEETTTQASTTSEQTTQESTTSEQPTQESSTTEKSTQESTTSEQTTTQQSTTESTTSESTTTEQTTSTTAEQSTTQQPTTEQQSTTEQTTESSTSGGETTEGNSSDKECPHTDDDQHVFVCPTSFRRHPKYCNMFYQCTEDDSQDVKIATFTCPNNTIYDENQTKCVEESKADKMCEGEIAPMRRFKTLDVDYREPIIASKQTFACPNTGYFTFEKDSECSPAFLKCKIDNSKKLRGYVYQCPADYFFWSISRRCEPINKIKDCKRSSNNWSGRWEIPVERRNVAST